jgi:hypothetical protein
VRSTTRSPPRKRPRPESVRLDSAARRGVQTFVRLLAGAGYEGQAIQREVIAACRRTPTPLVDSPDRRHRGDAGHVMTLWFSDPAFLDARGYPRPLPLRGARLSIEALAQRVDPNLDAAQVLDYFEEAGVVNRAGHRYVPRDRVLMLRDPGYLRVQIRGLFGLLRTLEHNEWCDRRTPRRVQLWCHNPRFPVSAVASFEKRLREMLNRLAIQVDADMHRCERARKPGERTVTMGVGVYQFEEDPGAEIAPLRRRRKAGQR